jgi:hypothetical protein
VSWPIPEAWLSVASFMLGMLGYRLGIDYLSARLRRRRGRNRRDVSE